MKKKRKFLLSFILLTLGIFCFATTAHAKSQLVQLKAGKTYTLDVNGDGKKDKLKFIQKTIQRDYPQQTHRIIYINGKKIKDITSYGSFPLYFYKTNNAKISSSTPSPLKSRSFAKHSPVQNCSCSFKFALPYSVSYFSIRFRYAVGASFSSDSASSFTIALSSETFSKIISPVSEYSPIASS